MSIDNVDKYYNDFPALDSVSFDVKEGEIFGYLGPNGSGKTVTIKLLLGLIKPSSGNVKILNINPYNDTVDSLKVRGNVGALLEWDGLRMNLTGMENVIYWAELYGLNKDEAKKRVKEVIESVKLSDRADTIVSNYSNGMKKRIGFARALVANPDILILDEPTAGVDPESRILIRKIIMDLAKKGKTIFFSSHDLEEVQKIASTIALIKKGKIIFKGSLKEMIIVFGKPRIFIQMQTPEIANTTAKKITEWAEDIKIEGSIISFTPKKGQEYDLDEINYVSSWTTDSSLEEAYLKAMSTIEEV